MKTFRTYLSNGHYLGRQLWDKQDLIDHDVDIKGDVVRWPEPKLVERRTVVIHYIKGEGAYRLDCMVNGEVTCTEYAGDWKTAHFLSQRWERA